MRILTIIAMCLSLNVSADTFTAKQIENAKNIEELRKTNKGGKNSKKIIELMNTNTKIEKSKNSKSKVTK